MECGRVYNYSISISNDNNNWTTVIPQATSASNEEWTIDEFPPVNARYVQVHFINNNQSTWAGLWEGEIWGIDSASLIDPVNNGSPNEYSLYQNYPNPFNPSTIIDYSVPEKSFIRLSVFNAIGQEVAILIQEEMEPGTYTITFNAANLPSGVYFYRLQSGNFIETRKMVLMK